MDDLDIGRTLLLWVYCFGLAGIEIEIEGGNGWAERMPTWWFGSGGALDGCSGSSWADGR